MSSAVSSSLNGFLARTVCFLTTAPLRRGIGLERVIAGMRESQSGMSDIRKPSLGNNPDRPRAEIVARRIRRRAQAVTLRRAPDVLPHDDKVQSSTPFSAPFSAPVSYSVGKKR